MNFLIQKIKDTHSLISNINFKKHIKKNIIKLIIFSLLSTACQDVIDVNLKTTKPRLVIDADIHWENGTSGRNQTIKLSLTAPYFNNTVPPATGATIRISNSSNTIFNFIEEDNSGIYKNDSFIPAIGELYNLNILYDNETYISQETMISVSPIEFVEQKNNGGFSGEEIEIKAFYTDPENIDNFYLFDFIDLEKNTSSLEVYDDVFIDGNQIFAFYTNENLESGNELLIRSSGISERTFNFFNILLQQTDEDSGDPFQTQPATVRGNCVNETNPDNFPLGYFRVSESDVFSYTIK